MKNERPIEKRVKTVTKSNREYYLHEFKRKIPFQILYRFWEQNNYYYTNEELMRKIYMKAIQDCCSEVSLDRLEMLVDSIKTAIDRWGEHSNE